MGDNESVTYDPAGPSGHLPSKAGEEFVCLFA